MAQTPVATKSAAIGSPQTASSDSSTRGMKFSPSVDGEVIGLGVRMPVSASKTITLWDFNAQSALASLSILAPGGNSWAYAALVTPVSLVSGGLYVVSVSTASAAYYRHVSQTLPMTQGDIGLLKGQYIGGNSFPAATESSILFVSADIQFNPTGGIPELGGSWGALEMA